MDNKSKRMTLSDLNSNNDFLSSSNQQVNKTNNDDDGEEVRLEQKRIFSGQDPVTSKGRTEVYRFGKLRSSQG